MKITFRKQPRETGLRAVGYPYPTTDIKGNGKVFGYISPPTWQTKGNIWSIHIAIEKEDINEDGNPNCTWKWMGFREQFNSEPEAREYVRENSGVLAELNLHFFEQ